MGLILMNNCNLSEYDVKCLRCMIYIHKDNQMRRDMTDKYEMNWHNTQIKAHNLLKSLSKTC